MELPDKIPFSDSGQYKLGAVTYEVTAHFCSDEDLKRKICALLSAQLKNPQNRTVVYNQKSR